MMKALEMQVWYIMDPMLQKIYPHISKEILAWFGMAQKHIRVPGIPANT